MSIGQERFLIFDLDGCIVDSSERALRTIDFAARDRGDMESYYRSLFADYSPTCVGDVPISRGIEILISLCAGLRVDRAIAVTMRGDEGRDPTTSWLREHLPADFDFELYMSPGRWPDSNGMYYDPNRAIRSAVEFKRVIALELLARGDVVLALDDHPEICSMYRGVGIPALITLYPGVDCLSPIGDSGIPLYLTDDGSP